jgi:hypothetical protein
MYSVLLSALPVKPDQQHLQDQHPVKLDEQHLRGDRNDSVSGITSRKIWKSLVLFLCPIEYMQDQHMTIPKATKI